jgi:hypothetical protein
MYWFGGANKKYCEAPHQEKEAMLKKLCVLIALYCMPSTQASNIEIGMYEKKARYSTLITHASDTLSYILFTEYRDEERELPILQKHIHNFFTNEKENQYPIKNQHDLIREWYPIEEYLREKARTTHIALTYITQNRVIAILRGKCGLYHFHANNSYSLPVCAEVMQNIKREVKKEEYVSLCGVVPWRKNDCILMSTPEIQHRIAPETIYTVAAKSSKKENEKLMEDFLIYTDVASKAGAAYSMTSDSYAYVKEFRNYDAAPHSKTFAFHAFAPTVELDNQETIAEVEKEVEPDNACIIIKSKNA